MRRAQRNKGVKLLLELVQLWQGRPNDYPTQRVSNETYSTKFVPRAVVSDVAGNLLSESLAHLNKVIVCFARIAAGVEENGVFLLVG